jgi:DNA-binding NarL/FixJ family response regulator
MDPAPPVLLLPDAPTDGSVDHEVVPPPGWRVHDGFDLPAEPWDVRALRLLCVGTVHDEGTARAAITAVTRGAGLAVRVPYRGSGRHRFLEDLHKIATPVAHEAPAPAPTDGLSPIQRSLLDALARGDTVTAAAQDLHVSRRTANRLLADGRARLGVETNAEAIRRLAAGRPAPRPSP